MFSFPREMEVSVSMKNGHKCDFFNVEEKYPMFKMKNIWIADFKSDTKEYLKPWHWWALLSNVRNCLSTYMERLINYHRLYIF